MDEKVAEPWDLTLGQLVGLDNSLALAKLRIELERELRHIAYNNQTDISFRPLGITENGSRTCCPEKFYPPLGLGTLNDITFVCDQAVHGTEVPDDITASVVRVGGQLLEQLRFVRNNGGTS